MNKKSIIERLRKEGHITLEEGLVLNEKETIYVPYQPNTYTYPLIYPQIYYTTKL